MEQTELSRADKWSVPGYLRLYGWRTDMQYTVIYMVLLQYLHWSYSQIV
jgi:hypothetical protein